jgi:hypothetical protein
MKQIPDGSFVRGIMGIVDFRDFFPIFVGGVESDAVGIVCTAKNDSQDKAEKNVECHIKAPG